MSYKTHPEEQDLIIQAQSPNLNESDREQAAIRLINRHNWGPAKAYGMLEGPTMMLQPAAARYSNKSGGGSKRYRYNHTD